MAVVWVPGQMRDLTGGREQVQAEGGSVRQVIVSLDQQFPGFQGRLLQDGELMPHIAVIVDGEEAQLGLAEPVQPESEVHFLPAMAGGMVAGMQDHDTSEPKTRHPSGQHVADHLANERTFLAWVRTGVAVIGLGFVVSRFALYLRSLSAGGAAIPATSSRSAVLGAVLVGLGGVTVLLALVRYLMTYRSIELDAYRPSRWLLGFVAALIAVAAAVMIAFLLTSNST
jgi:putative membrane protein